MQKLTAREPDEKQVEVAIESFKKVLEAEYNLSKQNNLDDLISYGYNLESDIFKFLNNYFC